jgi:predicted HicB family RNase H-like nuclease
MTKSLKGAVEAQFFSTSQVEQIENQTKAKKKPNFDIQPKEKIVNDKGYRVKVLQEIKSKRFNMLIQPSLYDDLKRVATANKTSMNDLVHQVLTDFVAKYINNKSSNVR